MRPVDEPSPTILPSVNVTTDRAIPFPRVGFNLSVRALALALLLYLEKILLTSLIDISSAYAAGGSGATAILVEHWAFRCVLTSLGALALFSYVREDRQLAEINAAASAIAIRVPWLILHGVLVLALIPLTYSLYGTQYVEVRFALRVALWLLAVLGAVLAAIEAMAPLEMWRRACKALGILWLYAVIAGTAAAYAYGWSQRLWQPTAALTFGLVQRLLTPIIPTLHADPATLTLGTDRFSVWVSEACSGLEGVGLMLAFSCAWLLYFRKEYIFPRALILIPIGLLVTFALNAVRIAALVLIGHAGYPRVAIYGFHSQAGWIVFNGVAFALAFVSRRSRWFNRTASPKSSAQVDNPTAVFLLPFLSILVAGTVAHAASDGVFEAWYALRLLAAALALWWCWPRLTALDWHFSWRGPATGLVVFGLWLIAAHFFTTPSAMPSALSTMSPSLRTLWIATRIVAAVLTVPIAEELAYRGFLLRRIMSSDFESVPFATVGWYALVLSAVLFGVVHGGMWLPGIAAGLLYGAVVVRTGRIGEAVAAHATSNALLAALVLLGGQWQLW